VELRVADLTANEVSVLDKLGIVKDELKIKLRNSFTDHRDQFFQCSLDLA